MPDDPSATERERRANGLCASCSDILKQLETDVNRLAELGSDLPNSSLIEQLNAIVATIKDELARGVERSSSEDVGG